MKEAMVDLGKPKRVIDVPAPVELPAEPIETPAPEKAPVEEPVGVPA